ncbi:putative bifunctional diguanylate cyclase/phosphodiesterase [Rhizohabitans arisaemae]|uniref:putative bifunctional diguanylate cyclase/phosphodiesterase n=1 Tax=Rhizohabitans arisaemae TaxID=2720610 RepID=UPI0024B03C99|nr:EAL domain-containing protein [Rhizohabitans arisaemae]
MKDPTDTRDIGPRAGSPLWTYLAGVITIGFTALFVAQLRLGADEYLTLFRSELFWILAVLVVFGHLRSVVMPGALPVGGTPASVMFTFATLLHFGLAAATLLQALAVVVHGIVTRKAWHRIVFNLAQLTLSFTAAAVVMGAYGVRPNPSTPWTPGGDDVLPVVLAGLAYFGVTAALVCGAVALHERRSVLRVVRATVGYQGLVHGAMLGLSPLVVVVMDHSVALVPLFIAPLIAVYSTATLSMRRDHQAMHDVLTGLPNRKLLHNRTDEALAEAEPPMRVGLFLMDLNRFKEVNDTLGHAVGDRLLQLVAHRLTHSVRPGDMVARLGGDEFAVLLPTIRSAAAAREVATRLRAALNEPVRFEGMTFDLDVSIGIALYPEHAPNFETLLQRADVAMYLAKDGRTGVESYSSQRDRNSPSRLNLMGDLRRGLDRGELTVFYQPKVSLETGRPVGAEALVRWRHPTRGLVPPSEFLPLAEQSYLMRSLTQYVIESALEQSARWWAAGTPVQVAVNLSARDLLDSTLPDVITASLSRHGVPTTSLQLEVTERILMTEQAYSADTVRILADLGIPLALDDFGTGYSSLVRLHRLRIEEVKIDASLVRRVADSRDDAMIVRSFVECVRSLGMRSVAEAVEDSRTAEMLREMGCDVGQGRWFGEPMASEAFTEWIREHGADPAGAACERRPLGVVSRSGG